VTTSGPPSWRSEEDYVLARLAVALGLLDKQAVGPALEAQARAHAEGQPLSLSQVLIRAGALPPASILQLKGELARCLRPCPACGQQRYLAAGPQYREEPCGRCGAPIPVPPAGSTLSASTMSRREAAFRQTGAGSQRFERDPFAPQGGAPRVFSHYVIEAQIAKGGMGAVYRARHAETGRLYALKVVLAGERATESQLHRFRREARAQTELDHPNIVKIHETGEWEGILYYTMDLVVGSDLAKAFPKLELRERARLLALVARAVHHAHEHGYVHRDLKPANVLLDEAGRPLVTDFGLAKNLGGETKLTQEGAVLGTPFYMSPEQATGQAGAVGPRSDVYALGVLLYELATLALPFTSETALELYRKIIEETPPTFAERGCLEPELELIALKAMAKAPEDRYESAAALADDLERWLRGERPLAERASRASRVARQLQRHHRSIGAWLGLVAAGLVVIAGLGVAARVALRRVAVERERVAWQEAATQAAAAIEHARAGPAPDEDGFDPARAAALDLALDLARAARTGALPPGADPAPLDAALAAGLLTRAELGLAARTGPGAARALACVAEALGAGGPTLGAAPHLLAARVARRRGAHDDAVAALSSARAATRDDGQAALLEALIGLDRALDDAAPAPARVDAALAALGQASASAGREGLLQARVARGRALALAGREADARAAFDEALTGASSSAASHRRVAEGWLLARRRREAAAHYRRALELDPAHVPTARALVAVLLGLGRPLDALRALEPTVRAGAPPELEVDLLRARTWSDPAAATAVASRLDALAATCPAAALLRADLSWSEGAAPYEALEGTAALAARARDRAVRGDADGARADLLALEKAGAGAEGAPRDVPPSAEEVRRARDQGFARLALGDAAGAAAAARAALRGAPGDPEATLLLVRAGAAPAAALHAAWREELEELDGPLGRAVALARLAAHWDEPALGEDGVALGRARVAGQRGLAPPLQHEAAALEHALGRGPSPEPLPELWAPVLPPRVTRPVVTPEARAEAAPIFTQAGNLDRDDDETALPLLRRGLALDPESALGRWEYAACVHRVGEYSPDAVDEWMRYLRADPAFIFSFVHKLRHDAHEGFRYRPDTPLELATAPLEAGDSPLRRAFWVLVHYLGHYYPKDEKPSFPRLEPDALRAALDRCVLADPGLAGLLYVRAHLAALEGRATTARRDHDLVCAALAGATGRDAVLARANHDLYRLWILAPIDVDEALKVAEALPRRPALGGKKYAQRAMEFVADEPAFNPLRGSAAWKKFVAEFTPN
jgi:tetratricopeptide (TPR) repeat protein